MKSKEELNALKEEVETVNKKLAELTDEELAQVAGGNWMGLLKDVGLTPYTNPKEYFDKERESRRCQNGILFIKERSRKSSISAGLYEKIVWYHHIGEALLKGYGRI